MNIYVAWVIAETEVGLLKTYASENTALC